MDECSIYSARIIRTTSFLNRMTELAYRSTLLYWRQRGDLNITIGRHFKTVRNLNLSEVSCSGDTPDRDEVDGGDGYCIGQDNDDSPVIKGSKGVCAALRNKLMYCQMTTTAFRGHKRGVTVQTRARKYTA